MVTTKDEKVAKEITNSIDMAHYKNKCFGKVLNYIEGWLGTIGCVNKESLLQTLKDVYYES